MYINVRSIYYVVRKAFIFSTVRVIPKMQSGIRNRDSSARGLG